MGNIFNKSSISKYFFLTSAPALVLNLIVAHLLFIFNVCKHCPSTGARDTWGSDVGLLYLL